LTDSVIYVFLSYSGTVYPGLSSRSRVRKRAGRSAATPHRRRQSYKCNSSLFCSLAFQTPSLAASRVRRTPTLQGLST